MTAKGCTDDDDRDDDHAGCGWHDVWPWSVSIRRRRRSPAVGWPGRTRCFARGSTSGRRGRRAFAGEGWRCCAGMARGFEWGLKWRWGWR